MGIIPEGYACPQLHPIRHEGTVTRTWCGPSAISALTGWTVDEAARWIWAHRGRKGTPQGIRGTLSGEVRSCLSAAGLGTSRLRVEGTPTLAQWLRRRGPELRKATVLIVAGNHWIVVKGRKLVDSHTKTPVGIGKAPHRRKRIEAAYLVLKPKRKRVRQYEPVFAL